MWCWKSNCSDTEISSIKLQSIVLIFPGYTCFVYLIYSIQYCTFCISFSDCVGLVMILWCTYWVTYQCLWRHRHLVLFNWQVRVLFIESLETLSPLTTHHGDDIMMHTLGDLSVFVIQLTGKSAIHRVIGSIVSPHYSSWWWYHDAHTWWLISVCEGTSILFYSTDR